MSSSLLTRAAKLSSLITAPPAPTISLGFKLSRFQSSSAAAVKPAPFTLAEEKPPRPFTSLEGIVSAPTFSSLTGNVMGLKTMTSVQNEVLSLLPELSEPYNPQSPTVRDLLVRAKTGTGKTIAFLIPAIEARMKSLDRIGKEAVADSGLASDGELEKKARRKYGRETVGALILSPTRELATQIANEAIRLTKNNNEIEVRLFTGGINKRLQMRDWMKGSRDIVVATTGRLRDLMMSEPEVLRSIKTAQTFILDEADTMLEMGFRDDIHAIQKELIRSPERQTLLFSATVDPVTRQVAENILSKDHKLIDCVGSDKTPVHANVPQFHTILPDASAQIPHVLRLIAHDQLMHGANSKIILFLPTTKTTMLFAEVVRQISNKLFPVKPHVYEIHSKRTMEARSFASSKFRGDRSTASILVTSDVSARGIDYPGVTRVIQVGVPSSTQQYIHRVGRTGRQGSTVGRCDLVLLPWEIGFITWQLTEFPIRALTVGEVEVQLAEEAKRVDETPKEADSPITRSPYAPFLSEFVPATTQIMARFDEFAIRENFMAMLGYYLIRSAELRVQKNVIVEGLKDWTVEAGGLQVAPFVSSEFLAKMGFSGTGRPSRTAQFFNKQSRDSSQPHWLGRGATKTKEGMRRSPAEDDTSLGLGDSRSHLQHNYEDGSFRRNPPSSGGYSRERSSGYGSREGGYQRSSGYGSREGGYQRSSGYGSREGGYQPRDRSSGYGSGSEGGYKPRERSSGYGSGSEGGYKPRERSSVYTPGARGSRAGGGYEVRPRKYESR
ncbi:P-loop containing nucleoside triphosphate hydrolase protein [Rhodocollybia butyracea]|uniref:ATP-dependent RNA helicase n=1 Tax=Rhodocollybia butyracea TaxID=206335 RepID=A0A9P5PBR2_9AGAR|nr:P-loop containing nucleoside triphosphate hydrolase protein [Rhodocollybia butyracea]